MGVGEEGEGASQASLVLEEVGALKGKHNCSILSDYRNSEALKRDFSILHPGVAVGG